jgi:uncharacterized protein (DUF169 family)
MTKDIKQRFMDVWEKYFTNAELPVLFYYTDDVTGIESGIPGKNGHCIFSQLRRVRMGETICFDTTTVACAGARRYLGFSDRLPPDIDWFLSCGREGGREGERYKKTTELAHTTIQKSAQLRAPGRYIVFKPWNNLSDGETPAVVVFFATPDVLSGLFTLANFDEGDPIAVIAPFTAGCGSVVQYPLRESKSAKPRCVLGLFDVSARPDVPADVLTFAIAWQKFLRMVENVEESFLITPSWHKVRRRIEKNREMTGR